MTVYSKPSAMSMISAKVFCSLDQDTFDEWAETAPTGPLFDPQ